MAHSLYTIGEIFRGKLMLNVYGKPYGDKAQVSKAVNRLKYQTIQTPYGPAKALPLTEIKKHNAAAKSRKRV